MSNMCKSHIYGILKVDSYNGVVIRNSESKETKSISCYDSTQATLICHALGNGTPLSIYCSGHTWVVQNCGYLFHWFSFENIRFSKFFLNVSMLAQILKCHCTFSGIFV